MKRLRSPSELLPNLSVTTKQASNSSTDGVSASPRRLIFRRTCSTSEKPAVSLKATSPSVANSGRPVANEPDDTTIAAASVATRANLLVSKRIHDPVPWGQFDTNYFQHR